MRKLACLAGALALVVAATAPIRAHHSFAMFDMNTNVTYEGKVVEYKWQNPHTHIIIQVPPSAKDQASVGTWDVEGGSTNIMTRQGWNKITYKAGDPITVVGHPMKDGSKGISLFYAVTADGKRLYHDIARPKTTDSQ